MTTSRREGKETTQAGYTRKRGDSGGSLIANAYLHGAGVKRANRKLVGAALCIYGKVGGGREKDAARFGNQL